jgi:hypothetical protein
MTVGEIGQREHRGKLPSLWPAAVAVAVLVAITFWVTLFRFEEMFAPLGGLLSAFVFVWLARRFGVRARVVDIAGLPAMAVIGFAIASVAKWQSAHTTLAFGPWFDQATRAMLAYPKDGKPVPWGGPGYLLHAMMVFVTGLGVAWGPLIVRFWPYCWHCCRYAKGGFSLLLPGGLPRSLIENWRPSPVERDDEILRESMQQARAAIAAVERGGRALAAVLPEPPRSVWSNWADRFQEEAAIFGGKRYARALGIHLSRCPRCNRGLLDLLAVGLNPRRGIWKSSPEVLEQRDVPPETMAEWLRVHEELRPAATSRGGGEA